MRENKRKEMKMKMKRRKYAAQTAYIQQHMCIGYTQSLLTFIMKSKYPKSNNKNNSIQNEHTAAAEQT